MAVVIIPKIIVARVIFFFIYKVLIHRGSQVEHDNCKDRLREWLSSSFPQIFHDKPNVFVSKIRALDTDFLCFRVVLEQNSGCGSEQPGRDSNIRVFFYKKQACWRPV